MLPLATLVHNNAKNGTTGFAPNDLLIRREPPATPEQAEGADNPLAEQWVTQLREQQILATQALNNAVKKATPTEAKWGVGQKVWLEAKNLALPYGTIKLAPRCYGPFKIMKVLSPVTYRLELPFQWTIHPVFHAALLTPYVETTEHGENYSRPPPDLIDNDEQYKVEVIRNHHYHGQQKHLQYLVKWMGYPESDNTWEPADNVQAPVLIKQYHRCHPLMTIKTLNEGGVQYQSNWVADTPNSELNERDLKSLTSISFPSFAHHPI